MYKCYFSSFVCTFCITFQRYPTNRRIYEHTPGYNLQWSVSSCYVFQGPTQNPPARKRTCWSKAALCGWAASHNEAPRPPAAASVIIFGRAAGMWWGDGRHTWPNINVVRVLPVYYQSFFMSCRTENHTNICRRKKRKLLAKLLQFLVSHLNCITGVSNNF